MEKLILEQLDPDMVSMGLCVKAVKQNPLNIKHVPEHLMNENLVMVAAKIDAAIIRDLDQKYISNNLIEKVLKTDGENLRHIPSGMITLNMCKTALLNKKSAWAFIPKKMINKELSEIYQKPQVYCGINI